MAHRKTSFGATLAPQGAPRLCSACVDLYGAAALLLLLIFSENVAQIHFCGGEGIPGLLFSGAMPGTSTSSSSTRDRYAERHWRSTAAGPRVAQTTPCRSGARASSTSRKSADAQHTSALGVARQRRIQYRDSLPTSRCAKEHSNPRKRPARRAEAAAAPAGKSVVIGSAAPAEKPAPLRELASEENHLSSGTDGTHSDRNVFTAGAARGTVCKNSLMPPPLPKDRVLAALRDFERVHGQLTLFFRGFSRAGSLVAYDLFDKLRTVEEAQAMMDVEFLVLDRALEFYNVCRHVRVVDTTVLNGMLDLSNLLPWKLPKLVSDIRTLVTHYQPVLQQFLGRYEPVIEALILVNVPRKIKPLRPLLAHFFNIPKEKLILATNLSELREVIPLKHIPTEAGNPRGGSVRESAVNKAIWGTMLAEIGEKIGFDALSTRGAIMLQEFLGGQKQLQEQQEKQESGSFQRHDGQTDSANARDSESLAPSVENRETRMSTSVRDFTPAQVKVDETESAAAGGSERQSECQRGEKKGLKPGKTTQGCTRSSKQKEISTSEAYYLAAAAAAQKRLQQNGSTEEPATTPDGFLFDAFFPLISSPYDFDMTEKKVSPQDNWEGDIFDDID